MMTLSGKLTALAAAAGVMFVISGCGGKAVVPASYNTFKAPDGSFKIEYPAEWQVENGGKSGYAWAKFTSGGAEISVDTSLAGSLIADIAKSGGPMAVAPGNPEDITPIAAVHEHGRQGFEDDRGVKEKTPEIVPTAGLSDARKSEYTGTSTFGAGIHGYRTTALTVDKQIRIICQCPESEWESLKPAFDKVIQSIALGR